MLRTKPPGGSDDQIGPASGRLRWSRFGNDLVAGAYRIRCLGPERWETLHRGAHLRIDRRRSMAIAMAEHYFREAQRIRQIRVWGALAVVGFVAASVSFAVSPPWGFGLFVAGLWLLAGSAPRCVASITRNLLDPYRIRESWESPDWWNRP